MVGAFVGGEGESLFIAMSCHVLRKRDDGNLCGQIVGESNAILAFAVLKRVIIKNYESLAG